MSATVTFRDLTALDEFATVVSLEREVWGPGYDDVVPLSILAVSVKRGGILIGAFADERMVGFVYSLPGLRDGRATAWSHMLGVVRDHRASGIGRELKRLQRERALDAGLDLVEWTFDPLQAANAHLNFSRLGTVATEYAINVYGESGSPLHRGTPTDRLIAEWWIREPRVEARLAGAAPLAPVVVEPANVPALRGSRIEPGDLRPDLLDRRVSITIPVGYTAMNEEAPALAREWRMATRELFTAYFGRGYRAVEFFIDPPRGTGWYLLER